MSPRGWRNTNPDAERLERALQRFVTAVMVGNDKVARLSYVDCLAFGVVQQHHEARAWVAKELVTEPLVSSPSGRVAAVEGGAPC